MNSEQIKSKLMFVCRIIFVSLHSYNLRRFLWQMSCNRVLNLPVWIGLLISSDTPTIMDVVLFVKIWTPAQAEQAFQYWRKRRTRFHMKRSVGEMKLTTKGVGREWICPAHTISCAASGICVFRAGWLNSRSVPSTSSSPWRKGSGSTWTDNAP
jgi:hypothetical protein